MKEIVVYTDGSAAVAGKMAGCGGFGVYFPNLLGETKAFSLGFKNAKTGQMEVLALLYAIKALPSKSEHRIKLSVYSDSEYVVKSFTENRLYKWENNQWTNSTGEVKNKQLWKRILQELRKRQSFLTIELNHIKSHQIEKAKSEQEKQLLKQDPNIIGNLMADNLANYKRHKELLSDISQIKY